MIVGVRLDHRMIHGQVAVAWCHQLNVTRIILIDDDVAKDDFQKQVLKMARPAGTVANIFSVEEALRKMPTVETLTDNIFIVFASVDNLYRFVKSYPKLQSVIYGGTKKEEGKTEYSSVVYLTEEEAKQTKEIVDMGIKIYMQQLPSTEKEEFILKN